MTKRLLPWLSRRVDLAAEELISFLGGAAAPEAASICVAATEALGSRRRWPPSWTPAIISRWSKRIERVWILEVLAYVLRAEFLNSTAVAVYASALVVLMARRCVGDRRDGSILGRCLLAFEATADSLSRHEVRVALFAVLATVSWLSLGDALELVMRAQQVAFATWAVRWTADAARLVADARRRAVNLAADLAGFQVGGGDRNAAPNDDADWRWRAENVDNLGRLAAELATPVLVAAAALALGALCVAPVLWCVGLVAKGEGDLRAKKIHLQGLLELLAADDRPSRRSLFAMNALLVATTLAPLANADAWRSALAALKQLAVQLRRRLYDAPVARIQPDTEDACAICLLPLAPDDHTPLARLEYCRYGCGRAVHADCMATWLAHKPNCVFCGVQWT